MFAQLCEYTENHWTIHFKSVNLMVCELCLNEAVKTWSFASAQQRKLGTKWKGQPPNGERYLQIMYLVKDWHLKYKNLIHLNINK